MKTINASGSEGRNPGSAAFPVHMLFIAVFPILSLYGHNVTQVSFSSVIRSLVIAPVIVFVVFLIIFAFSRKFLFSSLITTLGFLFFHTIVPFQSLIIKISPLEPVARLRFLIPFFLILFCLCAYFLLTKIRIYQSLTKFLNFFTLCLLIIPGFQISDYFLDIQSKKSTNIANNPDILTGQNQNVDPPDIYYLILDSHGRSDNIDHELGFDNSELLGHLEELGFYIAGCSNANYPSQTWQSMSATLNMAYFDHEKIKTQDPVQTQKEGMNRFKENMVLQKLEQYGYTFVSFKAVYDFLNFTEHKYYLDYTYYPGTSIHQLTNFELELLKNTPVSVISETLIDRDYKVQYDNTIAMLNELHQIPTSIPSPKFVYAHILIPHAPYIFSPTGEFVLPENAYAFSAEKYVDQVQFIDTEIRDIVDVIIKTSAQPPVIIIQGDHGYPSETLEGKAGILNAYYFPEVAAAQYLYPEITPVNTFRLIFDLYFGEDLELLPDQVYFDNRSPDWDQQDYFQIPYEFILLEDSACN